MRPRHSARLHLVKISIVLALRSRTFCITGDKMVSSGSIWYQV